MKASRFAKLSSVVIGCALVFGVVDVSASGAMSGKFTTKGNATGVATDAGAVTATVVGTGKPGGPVSTTNVSLQIGDGNGIGKKMVKVFTSSDATGQYSTDFVDPKGKFTGHLDGTLTVDSAPYTTPATLDIAITCTITYPPLHASCIVTLMGTPIPPS